MQDNLTISNKINTIKENIKNKIAAGDFNFSNEEKKYLERYPELSALAMAKLSEPGFKFDRAAYEYVNELDETDFTENLIFNMAVAMLEYDKQYFINNGVDEILSFLTSAELADQFQKIAYEKMPSLAERDKIQNQEDSNQSEEKNTVSVSELEELFRKKDYEAISKIAAPVDFSNCLTSKRSEIANLAREYPFETYGFPIALEDIARYFSDQYPYMSLNALVNLFIASEYYYGYQEQQIRKNVFGMILNKIQTIDDLKATNYFNKFMSVTFSYGTSFLSEYSERLSQLGVNIEIENKAKNTYDMSLEEFDRLIDEASKNDFNFTLLKSTNFQLLKVAKKSKKYFDLLLQHKDYKYLYTTFIDSDYTNDLDEVFKTLIKNKDEDLKKLFECDITEIMSNIYERYLDVIIEGDLQKDDSTSRSNNYLDFIKITTNIWLYHKAQILEYLGRNRWHAKLTIDVWPELQEKDYIEIFNNYIAYSKYRDAINFMSEQEIPSQLIADTISQNSEFAYSITDREYNIADFINRKEIVDAILNRKDLCTISIIEYINHNQDKLEVQSLLNKDFYEKTKDFICAYYNYDVSKLDYLTNKIGYSIFRYLDNENLKTILSMPIDQIEQILSLIRNREFTKIDLNGSYDAIKQYEFSKKHPDVTEIFPNILHSIDDVNQGRCPDEEATYHQDLITIANAIEPKFVYLLADKHNINMSLAANPIDLLEFICKVIKDYPDRANDYIDILHEITNHYIARQREEYRTTYNVYKDLEIPYTVDDKTKINLLVDILINSINNYFVSYYIFDDSLQIVITNLNSQGLDNTLILDVINYLKDPNAQLRNDLGTVKKNIRFVKDALKKYVIEHYDELTQTQGFLMEKLKKACADDRVKKTHIIEQSETDLCDLLMQLRFDILTEKVLSNEKIYKALLDIMNKRKLHLIPKVLSDYINESSGTDISYDNNYIIAFINYFYKIFEQKNIESLTLADILKTAKSYASVSSIYSQFLSDEDAKLIMENPKPNIANSKTRGNQRLNEALDLTIKNFERQEVTIPTFNEVLTNNGKSIRAIVGNFTHPSNLTHGERTGACMRIGGMGESLFYFALGNVNGFHIRFEDPETGKYISRVTGFRNGNTVFLNELRCTCDPDKYDDEEIIEFCRMTAKKMIELSKDSSCPIDNVVIHRAYATAFMKEKEINLGVRNIKEGLPSFYSDVNSKAILLASSNPNGSLVPVNLDKSKVPTYQVTREKIVLSENFEEMDSIINRVHAIKEYLKSRTFANIEALDFQTGFAFGMANQDWYVYVDENGMIHSEIIDIDKRAQVEYKMALQEAEEYIKARIVEKRGTYGF